MPKKIVRKKAPSRPKTVVRKKAPSKPKPKAEWYGLKVSKSGELEMVQGGGDRAAYERSKKAYASYKKKKK